MAKKEKNTRKKNYDPKLAINGSFADVIKVSVRDADKDTAMKATTKKKAKK